MIHPSKTRAHSIWTNMKTRCLNKNVPCFHSYGGRGITVCERWLTFKNFIADMGHPLPHQTLDRIDNDGNYCPENCRWATVKEQQRNTKQNRLLTAFGETKCIVAWLEDSRCRANGSSLAGRLRLGWDHERAITQEMRIDRARTHAPGEKRPKHTPSQVRYYGPSRQWKVTVKSIPDHRGRLLRFVKHYERRRMEGGRWELVRSVVEEYGAGAK